MGALQTIYIGSEQALALALTCIHIRICMYNTVQCAPTTISPVVDNTVILRQLRESLLGVKEEEWKGLPVKVCMP